MLRGEEMGLKNEMNHIASIITYGLAPGNKDFLGGHPSQEARLTVDFSIKPT
jgi:hypothetical protein